jgi:hypothetical protein
MSDTTKQPLPADPPDDGGGTRKAALAQESSGSTPLPADPPDDGGGTES